jgi:tetratricopeptide (TPR) repeat protein
MRLSARPYAPVALLVLPALLSAQPSPSEAVLCERVGDSRHPEARPRVQSVAAGAGAAAAFAQGCLRMADRRFDEAADAFERAAKQQQGSAVYHFWLGQAYGAQAQQANVLRQPSLARRTKQEFERAVQLDPDYLDARAGLMQFYLLAPGLMGGSVDKAREQAAEVRRRDPYRGAFLAASIAQRQKDVAGAMREYQAILVQYPDSVAPWLALATLHAQRKEWEQAWGVVDRMVKALPEAMVGQYAVGRVAAESGSVSTVAPPRSPATSRYRPKPGEPSLASAHWRLGAVREAQGQREAARAEYEAALRLDPSSGAPARHSTDCADCAAHRCHFRAVSVSRSGGRRGRRRTPCSGVDLERTTELVATACTAAGTEPPAFRRQWAPRAGRRAEALPGFLDAQARMLGRMELAEGLDLTALGFESPLARYVRMNLLEFFGVYNGHVRRHLWQAEGVRGQL